MRWQLTAIGAAILTSLACGGGGSEDPIVDLRFTSWDCTEGGYDEAVQFMADGVCVGSSAGWDCRWRQDGNAFTIDWTADGASETWEGVMIDPRGLEMGGTSVNGSTVDHFRCGRDL